MEASSKRIVIIRFAVQHLENGYLINTYLYDNGDG